MKPFIANILFGKDNRFSGVIAVFFVALIALGCTCGRSFDFADLGVNSNSSGASSNDSSFGGTTSGQDDAEMPSEALIVAMVQETTADFNLAVTTGDFSDMYEKASMDFQNTYTLEEMSNVFKDFVKNKRVVSPILSEALGKEPQFNPKPYMRNEKGLDILVVNGKYNTKRVPTNFEYEYVKRGGDWKLLKLIVKLQ